MKRVLAFLVLLAILAGGLFAADNNVVGLWKIIDDKSGKPNAIVYLYLYQGKMYGRMILTISKDTGQVDDTIYLKKNTSKKLAGIPPICGMDFVYNMVDKGTKWVGSIVDPEPGDEYECVISKDGDNLSVRGQLRGFGIFGRTQKWLKTVASDFPAGFVVPDPSTFVPVIPHK